MLDTNTVSDLLKHPDGVVAGRMAGRSEAITISMIVSAELKFGFAKRSSPRLEAQLNIILERLIPLPFGAGADIVYARVRANLERRGTPIGANDLLIAAHALALDATLVTDNIREFERVEGLRIENWLRA